MAGDTIGTATIQVVADATGLKAGISDAKSQFAQLKQAAKDAGEELTAGNTKYLRSLEQQAKALEFQTATFGKTKAETAAFKAELLGVSGTASTMVERLKAAETSLNAQKVAANAAADATKNLVRSQNAYGLTAGELSNSLRGVPAQFTDIVVSLSSGQRPLTVLLQQGGQLKDMFGGVGNAMRAIGGYVLGLINPFTIAAAAVAALGYAFFKGSQESKAFNEALTLSGNSAGVTASQMSTMAKAVSSTVGSQGAAIAAMTQLAASGKIAGSQFESITRAALLFEKATGTAVAETVKQFVALADEPSKASAKFNETLHYLSTSTYEQIVALEKLGRQDEAAALAQQGYSKAVEERSREIIQNTGYMEKAWNAVAEAAKGAWDAMKSVGRSEPLREQINNARQQLEQLENRGPDKPDSYYATQAQQDARYQRNLDNARAILATLVETDKLANRSAAIDTTRAQIGKDGIDAAKRLDAIEEQFSSKRTKAAKELRDFEQDIAKLRLANPNSPLLDPAKIAETRAEILKKYKDDPFRDEAATKMLEKLKEQEAVLRQQLSVETPLLESEKERVKIEQLIASLKGKHLTDDQKSLLLAQAKIKAQLDVNVAVEQQVNFEKKIADIQKKSDEDRKRFVENIATINTAMQTAAEGRKEQYDSRLEVFGKGSQALEELRSRQAINKEYAQYLRNLEDAARRTDSLGSADYKAEVAKIKRSLDESLQANADYYNALAAKQADWANGATQALQNYFDKSRDIARMTENLFTRAFQSMEDALVKFVRTGKLDFKSLADSIINDMIRIVIQQQITGPLAGLLGGFFSGAGGGGASVTSGAAIPFESGFPLASGLDFVPQDNFPALLHYGERVKTAAEARREDQGGTKITIENHGARIDQQTDSAGNVRLIIDAAIAEVDRRIASGTGSTAAALKSRGVNLSGALPRRA